jgi:hypothetical protein
MSAARERIESASKSGGTLPRPDRSPWLEGDAAVAHSTCTIDNCVARVHGHGMCKKHYLRWYRHADPRHGDTTTRCEIEGCAKPPRSRIAKLCEMHYGRVRRNGDPHTVVNRRKAVPSYRAAHWRVAQTHGVARSHACVDCGARAEHWSYDHTDTDALVSPTGQPYSLDVNRYEPRCARCHATFDGTGSNQYAAR